METYKALLVKAYTHCMLLDLLRSFDMIYVLQCVTRSHMKLLNSRLKPTFKTF